ncbi:hypothetical protein [Candidatus Halobonum tyrrellensis]|nr:hypothetical protein [Candidatus Halobonum tyrrellensis]
MTPDDTDEDHPTDGGDGAGGGPAARTARTGRGDAGTDTGDGAL